MTEQILNILNEMSNELHEGFENVYTHIDKIENSLTRIEDKAK
ncbi:hypothetical protein [Bacillus xiamenensis]|nr:hypothetical protein [Bacillus xiamenensis]